MINGLILDRVAFDTSRLEYQEVFLKPSQSSKSELCNNIMHAVHMNLAHWLKYFLTVFEDAYLAKLLCLYNADYSFVLCENIAIFAGDCYWVYLQI